MGHRPLDIIHIPAGEKHWHGTAADSEMSHLAIEAAGGELTQLEEQKVLEAFR